MPLISYCDYNLVFLFYFMQNVPNEPFIAKYFLHCNRDNNKNSNGNVINKPNKLYQDLDCEIDAQRSSHRWIVKSHLTCMERLIILLISTIFIQVSAKL